MVEKDRGGVRVAGGVRGGFLTHKARYEFTKIEMCYLSGKMLSAMHSHEK
jgi:hypothetical protein